MSSTVNQLQQGSARITTSKSPRSDSDQQRIVTVGLVPSPGLTEDIANDIREDLARELGEQIDSTVGWQVRVAPDPLSGSQVETPDLISELGTLAETDAWDYAISLTDLPIRREKRLVLADIDDDTCAGWISVPALGIFQIRRRVRRLVVQIIRDIYTGTSDSEDIEDVIGANVAERGNPSDAPELVDTRWVAPGKLAYLRLVSGMVYANEPWTIFPSFKTTIATAVATGTFAMIFASVWELGDMYSFWRLGGVVSMAIAILSAWVIISHRLWQPHQGASSQFLATLYNATTIVTVTSGVIFAYALIFLLLLFEASVFMPPDRLESMLGRSPDLINYLAASLVTGSVGTLAGALGAGLEETEAIRTATFGWRQQRRFQEYEEVREEEAEDAKENP